MELEFRNEKGDFLLSIGGEFAKKTLVKITEMPELTKIVRKLTKRESKTTKELVTFECVIESCRYKLFPFGQEIRGIEFILKRGGYIKVIN